MSPVRVPGGFLTEVRDAVGRGHVLTDEGQTAGHGVDWTGRFSAPPVPVLRPGTAEQVVAVVESALRHGVGLVPQGGNTGLVGGGVAMDGGVVVDLRRLRGTWDVDEVGGQLTAGAGSTIAEVQTEASRAGWAYGVDWAARDTATVGGSVATDAGGLRFVRHGGTRRQLLGIEAVLGSGALVSHLPWVEKDNTGYHLASVLCGSEGTLGLVTAARLRLVRPRGDAAVALLGFEAVEQAVDAAGRIRRALEVEALELMLRPGVDLVCASHGLADPLPGSAGAILLVESSSQPAGAGEPVDRLSAAISELPGLVDAAVATDGPSAGRLWSYRELHTESLSRLGPVHKLDVTLPLGELAGFITAMPGVVAGVVPQARVWMFGHVGDGNVHVNVTGAAPDDRRVDAAVLESVAERRGSISAEHGIGRAKKQWMHLAHSPAEIQAMRDLKRAFDPAGICNPGVLLPDRV